MACYSVSSKASSHTFFMFIWQHWRITKFSFTASLLFLLTFLPLLALAPLSKLEYQLMQHRCSFADFHVECRSTALIIVLTIYMWYAKGLGLILVAATNTERVVHVCVLPRISGYMFQPHRAIFRQHSLMEPTALCLLMSIVLIDINEYYKEYILMTF
jgi:hypothetical protein